VYAAEAQAICSTTGQTSFLATGNMQQSLITLTGQDLIDSMNMGMRSTIVSVLRRDAVITHPAVIIHMCINQRCSDLAKHSKISTCQLLKDKCTLQDALVLQHTRPQEAMRT
jgi:hypothetical protein